MNPQLLNREELAQEILSAALSRISFLGFYATVDDPKKEFEIVISAEHVQLKQKEQHERSRQNKQL